MRGGAKTLYFPLQKLRYFLQYISKLICDPRLIKKIGDPFFCNNFHVSSHNRWTLKKKKHFKYRPTTSRGIFVLLAKNLSMCLLEIKIKEMSVNKMPVGTMSVGQMASFLLKVHLCSSFFYDIAVLNFTNNSILRWNWQKNPQNRCILLSMSNINLYTMIGNKSSSTFSFEFIGQCVTL